MMFRLITVMILTGLFSRAEGAFEEGVPGSVARGMGGAFVAVTASSWGVVGNPSLLSPLEAFQVSVSFSPHRFGLAELATQAVMAALPTPWGTFGIAASHTGFRLYRELGADIMGGWRVAKGLYAGVSLRYYHLAIAGYGNGHALGFRTGLLIILSPATNLGFSAGNINAPVIGEADERLPQTLRVGIAVKPVPDLELAVDLAKDIIHPLQFQAGVQYRLIPELIVRAGTGVEPSFFGAGMGLRWSGVIFDYAFTRHPVLGISHFVAAGIEV
jgi:hypothetical protein